jgi:hypothetical protein
MENEKYNNRTVSQLKDELQRRGATTRGKKADLIDRLVFLFIKGIIFGCNISTITMPNIQADDASLRRRHAMSIETVRRFCV